MSSKERLAKLEKARAAVGAAKAALEEVGTLGGYVDEVDAIERGVAAEAESCRSWIEDNSRPYYGG